MNGNGRLLDRSPRPANSRGACFSELQLDQLQSAVRAAVREEFGALPRFEGWRFDPRAPGGFGIGGAAGNGGGKLAEDMVAFPVKGHGGLWGKTPDEPVAADVCSQCSTEVGVQRNSERQGSVSGRIPKKASGNRMPHAADLLRADTWGHVDSTLALDASQWARMQRRRIRKIVRHPGFDVVCGLVIALNSAIIGAEVQFELDGRSFSSLAWMESVFLVFFIVEANMRLIADGLKVFKSSWYLFDLTLVTCGCVLAWFIQPIFKQSEVPVLSQIITLRVLRLLRTVRAFRTIELFSELCRLCSGLLRSARTMLSVCLLVLLSVFCFSVLGVDLITMSPALAEDDETREIVESRFASLPGFMLTLMQFANSDSLAAIYYPLCRQSPLLVIYFMALWIVITVALMNLVTAVIVDSAMARTREEAEEKDSYNRKVLKKCIPDLEDLFDTIDKDSSGSVTLDEINEMDAAGELKFPEEINQMIAPDQLLYMFEFLDQDQSGEIDKSEFVDGVCCLALSSVPIETTQMLQLLRSSHDLLTAVHHTMVHLPAQAEVAPVPSSRRSSG